MTRTNRLRGAAALVGLLLAVAAWLAFGRGTTLPPDLTGAIVFVSDRDGVPALYWRRLPRDRECRLTIELRAKARETLVAGEAFYRTLAPSPDGRFLAATRSADAALPPLAVLLGHKEEVHLLDDAGRQRGRLEFSRRHANHSPDWGR